MLSHVLRLAFQFQRAHGHWPNMLYLNREQFTRWRHEFSEPEAFEEITRRLSLDVVISADALQPKVAWLPDHNHGRPGHH